MIRSPERSWKSGRISSSSLLFNVILVSSRSLFCLFLHTGTFWRAWRNGRRWSRWNKRNGSRYPSLLVIFYFKSGHGLSIVKTPHFCSIFQGNTGYRGSRGPRGYKGTSVSYFLPFHYSFIRFVLWTFLNSRVHIPSS